MWLFNAVNHLSSTSQEEPELTCWSSAVTSAEVGSPSPLSPSAASDPDYPDSQSSHHKVTLPTSLSSSHYQLQLTKFPGRPVGDSQFHLRGTSDTNEDVPHKVKRLSSVSKHTTDVFICGVLQTANHRLLQTMAVFAFSTNSSWHKIKGWDFRVWGGKTFSSHGQLDSSTVWVRNNHSFLKGCPH